MIHWELWKLQAGQENSWNEIKNPRNDFPEKQNEKLDSITELQFSKLDLNGASIGHPPPSIKSPFIKNEQQWIFHRNTILFKNISTHPNTYPLPFGTSFSTLSNIQLDKKISQATVLHMLQYFIQVSCQM